MRTSSAPPRGCLVDRIGVSVVALAQKAVEAANVAPHPGYIQHTYPLKSLPLHHTGQEPHDEGTSSYYKGGLRAVRHGSPPALRPREPLVGGTTESPLQKYYAAPISARYTPCPPNSLETPPLQPFSRVTLHPPAVDRPQHHPLRASDVWRSGERHPPSRDNGQYRPAPATYTAVGPEYQVGQFDSSSRSPCDPRFGGPQFQPLSTQPTSPLRAVAFKWKRNRSASLKPEERISSGSV